MTDDDKPRLEIDWLRAAGGALAAVSTAVLLSTLGAAGTLIGAAVGSFALTVTSAVYTQGLARSKHRLTVAQQRAQDLVDSAQSQVRRAGVTSQNPEVEGRLEHAEGQLDEARAELESADEDAESLTWGQRLALLPWKKIVLLAVGFFLTAMLVITVFELIAGRSVSSITGGTDSRNGTTISKVTGNGSSDDSPEKQEKDGETTPTRGPSDGGPATTEPTTAPSDEPTSPDDVPSSEPSDPETTPTEEPTSEPSTPAPTPEGAPAE